MSIGPSLPPPAQRAWSRRALLARSAQLVGALAAGGVAARSLSSIGSVIDLAGARPTAVSAPAIVTRAEWGADERLRRDTPRFHPIRKFVIHHTATPNGDGDPHGRMRSIFLGHLHRRTEDGQPWSDIGYNFVVDEQGRIYEGRYAREYGPDEVHDGEDVYLRGARGAHAGEWNGGTVGVALIGNYDGRRPSDATLDAIVDLITWKCARHGLDAAGVEPWTASDGRTRLLPTIVGHRDVRATRCPGSGAYAVIAELRQRVADRVGTVTPVASTGPGGYRVVHGTGDVTLRGSASDLGDLADRGVRARVVSAAPVPGREGFWMADSDGGVHGFGDAPYRGSVPGLRARGETVGIDEVVAMAAVNDAGYWLMGSAGSLYAFEGASLHGSIPGLRRSGVSIGSAPMVALEPTSDAGGYWILDGDGGVFGFGTAAFAGSIPGLRTQGLVTGELEAVDLRAAPGGGYWILDSRGGVFSLGGAPFFGSVPATGYLGGRARRLVPTPTGLGYLVLSEDGGVMAFGDAAFHGHGPHLTAVDLLLTS